MPSFQFSDEKFNTLLEQAQEFYPDIGEVLCPYFRAPVQFNALGFEHLRRKSWNRGRSRRDQFMRLKHLEMAPVILRLSSTVQGIHHGQERIRQHRHGRWEEIFFPVTFYEFMAVIETRRFKVVVKHSVGKKLMFWSLIPYWRRTKTGTRVMHEGNPAED